MCVCVSHPNATHFISIFMKIHDNICPIRRKVKCMAIFNASCLDSNVSNQTISILYSLSYGLATGMKNTTGNSIKTIELIWWLDLKSLTCSNEHDIHIPFSWWCNQCRQFQIIFFPPKPCFHAYETCYVRSYRRLLICLVNKFPCRMPKLCWME